MMRKLFLIFLFLPATAFSDLGQLGDCKNVFLTIAHENFVSSGQKSKLEQFLTSEALRTQGVQTAHSIEPKSMEVVSVKDIDPGSSLVRRAVTIEARLQESSPLKLELYFLTEGSFECSNEEVLNYTGFRLLPL